MQGWIVTPHALAKDIKGLSKNATCRKRQQNRNFMEKKWQTVDIIMNQTEIACSQMSWNNYRVAGNVVFTPGMICLPPDPAPLIRSFIILFREKLGLKLGCGQLLIKQRLYILNKLLNVFFRSSYSVIELFISDSSLFSQLFILLVMRSIAHSFNFLGLSTYLVHLLTILYDIFFLELASTRNSVRLGCETSPFTV